MSWSIRQIDLGNRLVGEERKGIKSLGGGKRKYEVMHKCQNSIKGIETKATVTL